MPPPGTLPELDTNCRKRQNADPHDTTPSPAKRSKPAQETSVLQGPKLKAEEGEDNLLIEKELSGVQRVTLT
ncbi:hypothetical protein EUX98_g1755 [Antrodiella citrinella]|uniref:Uncharacterized protein n=1 Tax=Antrodiella citrinella TaxID=2447956 RepID=A0A4S4N2X6_9APHY|nr:hypothetical protein EUX98_g1755 [Antrodiella citrinella]